MRWTVTAMAGIISIGAPLAAVHAAAIEIPEGFTLKNATTLVHTASGTQFPLRLAGFTRAYEHGLDARGKDIVISYRQTIDGKPVVARIALVQIVGMSPKEHYLGMKSIIGTYFTDLTFTDIIVDSEAPFTPPGMAEGSGYQGRFRARGNGVPYELSLSTVKLGDWDARLTAAYPAAAQDKARDRILTLAAGLLSTGPATE